jgi:hypothetical protein
MPGRLQDAVSSGGGDQQSDADGEQQRRQPEIHPDDAPLVAMGGERGQEGPDGRDRQQQQDDGALRQKGRERDQGRERRSPQSTPIE